MIESSIRSRDLEIKASFVAVKRLDRAPTNTLDDPTHVQACVFTKSIDSTSIVYLSVPRDWLTSGDFMMSTIGLRFL